MNKVKSNIRKNFTICPNALINDNSITAQARFLFVYMSSKPDNWTFKNPQLASAINCNEQTLRKYMSELVKTGWIRRERTKTDNNQLSYWSYTLNEEPCDNFPPMEKPPMEKPPMENYKVINNTDYNNIDNNNTLIEREETEKQVINYLLKMFGNDFEIRPTGKYRQYIKQLIDEGKKFEQFKTVIDRRNKDYRVGKIKHYLVEPDVMFKPDLFIKELNAAKQPEKKDQRVKGEKIDNDKYKNITGL